MSPPSCQNRIRNDFRYVPLRSRRSQWKFPERSPEASLAHADAQYPSFVIETSFSQTQKSLARSAGDYICGSDGIIAVVLGFDIEYGVQSKRAALSVWRPRTVKDEEGEQALILESVRDREANQRSQQIKCLIKRIK
jgi:hypothetical protein